MTTERLEYLENQCHHSQEACREIRRLRDHKCAGRHEAMLLEDNQRLREEGAAMVEEITHRAAKHDKMIGELQIFEQTTQEQHRVIEGHEAAMRIIDIVFDGPPSNIGPCFVEVEEGGKSIKLGEWIKREDGYWVIRFRARLEKP